MAPSSSSIAASFLLLLSPTSALNFGDGNMKKDFAKLIGREPSVDRLRLHRAASQRNNAVTPESMDPSRLNAIKSMGYEYAPTGWTRGPPPKQDEVTKTNDDDFDPRAAYDMASSAFDDLPAEQSRYTVNRRAKFTRRSLTPAEKRVEVTEELARLGFAVNSGEWTRGPARETALTVVILNGERALEVLAQTEEDIAACARLDYVLQRSALEGPENVADALQRWARDYHMAPVVWAVIQFKLWTEFNGNFDSSSVNVEAMAPLVLAFVSAHWLSQRVWAGSKPVLVDGFERAIAGNNTVAASLMSVGAAVPRVAMMHGYLQEHVQSLWQPSLTSLMDESHNELVLGVVFVGLTAAALEFVSLRYARPPKTVHDELEAIQGVLDDDVLTMRILSEANDVRMGTRKSSSFLTEKAAEQQFELASKRAESFVNVAAKWQEAWSLKEPGPSFFAQKTTALAGVRGAIGAVAYAVSGGDLAAPLLLHAVAAATDLLPAQQTPEKQTKKTSLLSNDKDL